MREGCGLLRRSPLSGWQARRFAVPGAPCRHPWELFSKKYFGGPTLESSNVGQVIGGCINKVGAQAMNITRTAWLSHGGSQEVGCVTVDSQCGSSQYSVNLAHALISSGQEDVVLACGVGEHEPPAHRLRRRCRRSGWHGTPTDQVVSELL